MAKVGETYLIEIAEVIKGAESGKTKYRIKGFDNLIFDEKGIEKLTKFDVKEIAEYIHEYIKEDVRNREADAYKRGFVRGIKSRNQKLIQAFDNFNKRRKMIEGED